MVLRNESEYELDLDMVRSAIEYVLKNEGKSTNVSVAFVKEEVMKDLNENYRKKSGPTDVLTFLYDDEDIYGEIIMCPAIIERDARDYGLSFEEELLLTAVHSALHLCGYDHEFSKDNAEEMMEKQKKYFEELRDRLL